MTANEAYTPEELEPDFDKIGFFNLDMEVYKSVLCTNTLGSVIPTRVFAKQMIAVGGGSILNFASMNTYCPLTKVPAYAMAKAAVSNFTQWLGGYLAPAGIRVNAIAPGFFANERSRTSRILESISTLIASRSSSVKLWHS
jgi:NAD(P)-dependent dehydrogenase (short-subunit alcohol dehydrogenase family)